MTNRRSEATDAALELADELAQIRKDAKKEPQPPVGTERVPPSELRKRYPHMGDEGRKKLREGMATPDDPMGVHAMLRFLNGEK